MESGSMIFRIFLLTILFESWLCCDAIKKQPSSANEIEFGKILTKKDWQNHAAIEEALNRTGLGEIGAAASIQEYAQELSDKYGYNAILSDYISAKRAIPDERPRSCRNITYLSRLPKASVIITFHNEHLSVLSRTLYSILDRTPDELLNEIILVDDGSTNVDLKEPLDVFLRNHSKIHLIRLSERVGLMRGRMTGARVVKNDTEVLVFLDSHMEVMYNWLPPLLEPIALDSKTCSCPEIDSIDCNNFQYGYNSPFRVFFTWSLSYRWMSLKSWQYLHPERNRRNFIMIGGAMAIGRDFFSKLGGFDEGMNFWGGEQFEMSFKIWMCGGSIIDVPCSRVAHLYRNRNSKGHRNLYGDYNFLNKNLRRVVDVWLDGKYQDKVYEENPSLRDVDPGDLNHLLKIRENLQCKNFSWMLENVMSDQLRLFPLAELGNQASGRIRNVIEPNLCFTDSNEKEIILTNCTIDQRNETQNWLLSWRGEIISHRSLCIDADIYNQRAVMNNCYKTFDTQQWIYNRTTMWIVPFQGDVLCLTAVLETQILKLAYCDTNDVAMKWQFDYINETLLDSINFNYQQNRIDPDLV